MAEANAPEHIMQYCYKDDKDDLFLYLCKHYATENSFVYKLRCNCGCNHFIVYHDKHPSILAECSNCGKVIIVYDLVYYPAAVKLKKDFKITKVRKDAVFVYVNYEYDDEYLYEDDVYFDPNDITWGKVFIANDNELTKILDDETA